MAISIHTTWKKGWENIDDVYSLIEEAGFDGVDLDLSEAWDRPTILKGIESPCIFTHPMDEIKAHYKEELDSVKRHNLVLYQAHAPFPPYVPGFEAHLPYATEIYKKCISFCGEAGIPKLVIHGSSRALTDHSMSEEENEEMNKRLFKALAPVAKEKGVMVLLENLFTRRGKRNIIDGTCTDWREAVEEIDLLNKYAGCEVFGLCLDTGHLNICGKSQDTYIRALGKRIKAVHMHDNWGDDDSHMMPYTGNIIWEDVLTALHDVGYSGNINFETYQQTMLENMPKELIPVFLKAEAEVARYFEKRIIG